MEFLILIICFFIILKSSDVLIDAASNIATKLKVSKMLIALTIVAFGTCAPELAISFQSISSNNGTMALANVVGSCIVNVLLIIGLASFIRPIRIKNATIKKELPILVFITSVFCFLVLDNLFITGVNSSLSRTDGIILLLMFGIFLYYIVSVVRKQHKQTDSGTGSILKSFIYLVIATVLIIISSELIVDNSIKIAEKLNISQKVITLVFIVIGTSLPELFTTVSAAKKGEFEIAVGNIIGTNIFNICVVLGLPITVYGRLEIVNFNFIDMFFVFTSSFLLFLFARSEKKLNKVEGIIMILIFTLYYAYVMLF